MYDPFTVKTMPGRRRKSRSVAFEKRMTSKGQRRIRRMRRVQVSGIDWDLVRYLMHVDGLDEETAIHKAKSEGQTK